jgi:4-amino-4-deoxy-L-arabinose transferase-like glycosyltransferase
MTTPDDRVVVGPAQDVRRWSAASGDLVVPLLALGSVVVHALTNGQYGFHRDELATIDDARHLAWGYVAYPPLTPAIARLALELFGPSLPGLRLFAALAQGAAILLAGLMARELGGGRWARVVTCLAVTIAPMSLLMGALFQYVAFDYLWWTVVAYCAIRLLRSEDPRWWLGIGAAIGLGMLTKYTMAFCTAGLVAGVLLTSARRYLASRWLWGGAALALLIALPNLLWQAQHGFVSLEYLAAIHVRDVAIGRTQGYLVEQLFISANPFTIPLWVAGLWFYLFSQAGRRYRPVGWMYLVPFALFLVAQGRSYYLGPAYPMLLAAGAVVGERWIGSLRSPRARLARGLTAAALAAGAAIGSALMLPIAPVGSGLWDLTSAVHDNFVEQIGWPELVETVARIHAALPAEQRARTAILAGNYGEAGAVDLYGPAHDLPGAISGVNSYWARGYGQPPPESVIVLGFSREAAERLFARCRLAGRVANRYGVQNEETRDHPDIFLCDAPRQPWPELWSELRRFA